MQSNQNYSLRACILCTGTCMPPSSQKYRFDDYDNYERAGSSFFPCVHPTFPAWRHDFPGSRWISANCLITRPPQSRFKMNLDQIILGSRFPRIGGSEKTWKAMGGHREKWRKDREVEWVRWEWLGDWVGWSGLGGVRESNGVSWHQYRMQTKSTSARFWPHHPSLGAFGIWCPTHPLLRQEATPASYPGLP